MVSFTGDHNSQYKRMTVINYNGSDAGMNALKKEQIVFAKPPAGAITSDVRTNYQTDQIQGKYVKEAIMTHTFKDGTKKVEVKTL